MAAQTTDLFRKTGAGTVTTLAAPGKALSATSITVGATTNYPTGTGLVIAIRIVDSAGELVAGTYTEWNAIVASGTSFTIEAAPVYGSDQVYPAGSTTQVFIPLSSSAHNDLIDGILTHADQDGTLKAGAVDVAAVLATDVVETAKIKDLNVTTAKIADGAATSEKLTSTVAFSAYNPSGTIQTATTTPAVIQFNTELYDIGSDFDTTTYTFTAPYDGIYHFSLYVLIDDRDADQGSVALLYVNGSQVKIVRCFGGGTTSDQGAMMSAEIELTAGDTVQGWCQATASSDALIGGSQETTFSGYLIGRN